MSTKRIAYIGIFISMALVLSYFERMLPPPVPVPGIKLGLSNVIILLAFYILNAKDAFMIMIIKVIVVGILFGGVSGMIYGLSGGLLSYIFMYIFIKLRVFSIVGVSIIGGVTHNLGQLVIAAVIINNYKIMYYMPALIIFGIISGLVTGIVAYYANNNLNNLTI